VKIKLYFSNSKLSGNNSDCNKSYPVERTISKTPAIATAALHQLFLGPTAEEVSKGYSSLFSDKTRSILRSVEIANSVAYVNLVDIRQIIPNASTSCGAASFLAQTGATLKQFSTIKKVIYAIDGKTSTFYKWLQIGCGPDNNDCDDTPFSSN
jgi:spore germination protein GerM